MRLFQEGIKYSEQSFLAAWQKELREMLGSLGVNAGVKQSD